jgi:hypothetical protein
VRLKALGISVLAVLALGAPVSASSASRAVWVKWGGERLAPGTGIEGFLVVGECFSYTGKGTVVSNGGTSDKLSLSKPEGRTCFNGKENYALHFGATSWVLTTKGLLTVTGKIVYGEPNWCAYDFTKLTFHIDVTAGNPVHATAGATGKLDTAASLGESCTVTKFVNFAVGAEKLGSLLVTELA